MPIRDDSAGSYGTWNNDDLSWLDYLKANASDGGNALSNLGRNLVEGFSPIGTSEQGNMALQVPPIVSGIAQSYSNLAGSPSRPGNAYDLTGVPELDAPIQQDMSNVLLSLYGGNAAAGLARGATKATAERRSIRAYHGMDGELSGGAFNGNSLWANERPDIASKYAEGLHRSEDSVSPSVIPLDLTGAVYDATGLPNSTGLFDVARKNARDANADIIKYAGGNYEAINRGTAVSPFTGETLFSDTGKPSILGSAMAGAGDAPLPMDHASRMARAREMGFDDTVYYHGSQSGGIDAFDMDKASEGWRGSGVHITSSPADAAFWGEIGPDYPGAIYPLRTRVSNPADFQGTLLDSAMSPEQFERFRSDWGNQPATTERVMNVLGANEVVDMLKSMGHDALRDGERLNVFDPSNIRSVNAAFDPARAGENGLLLSDNRPSLLGSALATGGENYDLPEWLRF